MRSDHDRQWQLKKFMRVWNRQARKGLCDAPGSSECQRVMREWVEAGEPAPVYRFIRIHANVPGTSTAPIDAVSMMARATGKTEDEIRAILYGRKRTQ